MVYTFPFQPHEIIMYTIKLVDEFCEGLNIIRIPVFTDDDYDDIKGRLFDYCLDDGLELDEKFRDKIDQLFEDTRDKIDQLFEDTIGFLSLECEHLYFLIELDREYALDKLVNHWTKEVPYEIIEDTYKDHQKNLLKDKTTEELFQIMQDCGV